MALSLLLLLMNDLSYSQSKKKKAIENSNPWRYEIEAVQTGSQGTFLIKVWSYSKTPELAIEQSKKNAVHGIIFQGFAGKQGVPGQKPLANSSSLEYEKADFFNDFFSDYGGRYMKFVSLTTDGSVSAQDRLKIDKKTYKIGVVVSVNVSLLRKDLEDAGIIKKLGSGF